MKITLLIQRVMCQIIDTLIILIPVQFIIIGVFGVNQSQANFLFTILLAVYETIAISSFNGMTIGKYFGKLHVIDKDMAKPTMLYVGLRSLAKSMYYLPVIGAVVALVSLFVYIAKGTTLHDIIGRTTVVMRKTYKEIFDDRGNV